MSPCNLIPLFCAGDVTREHNESANPGVAKRSHNGKLGAEICSEYRELCWIHLCLLGEDIDRRLSIEISAIAFFSRERKIIAFLATLAAPTPINVEYSYPMFRE